MKNSRKLLFSILALAVALSAAVTATFAWFTSGNKANINSFDIGMVTNTTGLAIGVETSATSGQVKYYNKISVKDLLASKDMEYVNIANNYYIAKVTTAVDGDAVSSRYTMGTADSNGFNTYTQANDGAKTLTFYKMNASCATQSSNAFTTFYDIDGTTALVENVDYLSFRIYFKTDSANAQNVYLSQIGSDITSPYTDVGRDIVAWSEFSKQTYGKALTVGQTIKDSAACAMRIGFAGYTGVASGDGITPTATYEGTKILNVWDPYKTIVEETGNVYKRYNASAQLIVNDSYCNGNLANDYYNQFYGTHYDSTALAANLVTSINDGAIVQNADNKYPTAITKLVKQTIATPSGDETATQGYTEIKLWAEGWDGDCFNAILGDTMQISLAFVCFAA